MADLVLCEDHLLDVRVHSHGVRGETGANAWKRAHPTVSARPRRGGGSSRCMHAARTVLALLIVVLSGVGGALGGASDETEFLTLLYNATCGWGALRARCTPAVLTARRVARQHRLARGAPMCGRCARLGRLDVQWGARDEPGARREQPVRRAA